MFESSHPDEAVMVHTESRRPFILSLFQFGDFDGLVGAGPERSEPKMSG